MTDSPADSPKADMPPQRIDAETVDAILGAVGSLRYGAVEVTVHDGRVVQLDKRERIRFKT